MLNVIALLATLAGIFPSATASAAPPVELSLEAAPLHGLPAMPPTMKITFTNKGHDPITLAGPDFRAEVTRADGLTFVMGCDNNPSCSFSIAWFDRSHAGPVTLSANTSQVYYVDAGNNAFFFDPRLLVPGRYTIRIFASLSDVASNSVSYIVDEPQGENRPVWQSLRETADEGNAPFFRSKVMSQLAAHPNSDYSKAWAYYIDRYTSAKDAGSRQALQRYLASGLPEALDVEFRLQLAGGYQAEAEQLALSGNLDDAETAINTGRSILDALQASANPYAAGGSRLLRSIGPWSRMDLIKFADAAAVAARQPLKAVEPRLNCVTLNTDGTYSARFGYVNRNRAVLQIPISTKNNFDGAREERGQPINFLPGDHENVFSVIAPVGEKLVWILDGMRATASANEGVARCTAAGGNP